MTGRALLMEKTGKTVETSNVVLSVQHLSLQHTHLPQTRLLNNISFNLHKGEL